MATRSLQERLYALRDADWRTLPANGIDAMSWSFGTVETVADLYDPSIFGARRDFRCECGNLAGKNAVGFLCPRCDVLVTANAWRDWCRRMAKIDLGCYVQHPLRPGPDADERGNVREMLDYVPVVPIAFRVEDDGPNELGRRYERLVEANAELAQRLPPRNREDYVSLAFAADKTAVEEALRDLLGVDAEGTPLPFDSGDDGRLVPLLFDAMIHFSAHAAVLARSCMIVLDVRARV